MKCKLNILYLHSHDTGRCIEPYGYNVLTPNLQHFAEDSILFRHAFCTAPTCSPSRAGLLTGQYPHVCGMFGLASSNYGFTLKDYSHHLAQFLQDNGYQTALAGVQHEARTPWADPHDVLGYQFLLGHTPEGMPVGSCEQQACDFLAQDHDHPWFLSCGFKETHRDNPQEGIRHGYDDDLDTWKTADDRYVRPPAPIPDIKIARQDWASYRAGAKRLDEKIGRVLEQLDKTNQRHNTLIIITTDHGIAWPHGKGNLTDFGTGVMLMMAGPDGTGLTGGGVIDGMVSHLDVYPTLCDLLNLDKPDWLQGESMVPLINQQSDSIREYIFTEQNYHGLAFDPQRAIRTERYKYILRAKGPYIRIVDPGPINKYLRSKDYASQPDGTELFYDLDFDPSEQCNRIGDMNYQEVITHLRQKLYKWMQETDDPFLEDEIPPVPASL